MVIKVFIFIEMSHKFRKLC